MELKLDRGDYVPDGLGGVARVTGAEELLQRAFLKLTARRGAFPLQPEFGSRLYLLAGTRASRREAAALAWAAEALRDEPGLAVTAAELSYPTADRLRLGLTLRADGSEYGMELEVTGG